MHYGKYNKGVISYRVTSVGHDMRGYGQSLNLFGVLYNLSYTFKC